MNRGSFSQRIMLPHPGKIQKDGLKSQGINNLFVLLALIAVCFAAYGNTLNYDFVLDDYALIVNNPAVKNLKNFASFFFTDLYHSAYSEKTSYYRPILLLSYGIDHAVWKLNPLGFHLTNIIIHILNGYLAFLLLRTLFGNLRLAFGTALIFCLHPIQTTAVAYISGRADLLCAFFLLLGSINLINYSKTGCLRSYALTLITAAGALLSRENGILFPLTAFLVLINCRIPWKKALLPCAGILAITCFYLANRLLVMQALMQSKSTPMTPLQLPLELLNILNVLKEYFRLLFFPYPLYPMKTIALITAPTKTLIVFIASMSALITITIKYKLRITGFGLLWSSICLLPILIGVHIFPTMGLVMAEHWLYLPSIGIFTVLIFHSLALKRMRSLWLMLLSCALGISTISANTIWKNDVSLSRHVLRFAPDNGVAYLNLASAYYRMSRYDDALYTIASLSSPEPQINFKIQNMLGKIYEAKKYPGEAIAHYKRAAQIQPDSHIAYYNLGLIHLGLNDIPNSYRHFLKAWRNNPGSSIVYLGLGNFYQKLRRPRLALLFYKEGLKLNPYDDELLIRSADCLQEAGLYPEARKLLEGIMAKKNIALRDIKNIAAIYGNMGDFSKTIALLEEVLQKNPYDLEVQADLKKASDLQKLHGPGKNHSSTH